MNVSSNLNPLTKIAPTHWIQRWEIYYRLQSLGIACECGVNQPLQVVIQSPLDIIQVWAIMKQVSSSRLALINHLENCWQLL